MVVPYRASLMLKGLPPPLPVVLGVMKHDKERREGESSVQKEEKRHDSERMFSRGSPCLGSFSRQDFDKDNMPMLIVFVKA